MSKRCARCKSKQALLIDVEGTILCYTCLDGGWVVEDTTEDASTPDDGPDWNDFEDEAWYE